MAEKILSICIPTYNRAELLDKTLSELVLEPSFQSGKIEICISDNASPDSTELIVKKYKDKFVNIIYNRNIENTMIIDGNFPIVADLASGVFIKFLNDYTYFIPGELDRIIEFIETNKKEKPILFFSNNSLINKSNELIFCDSLNSFVKNASYWTTWVLAAGFWRDDFLSIKERDRSIEKFMWCPDNYLRLVCSGRNTIIYNRQFCTLQPLRSKSGYNVFYTFGVNYLSLYDEYLKNGLLSRIVYRSEKYILFRYFLFNWYQTLVINSSDIYKFDNKSAFKILLKNYCFKPYFYASILYLYLRKVIKIISTKYIFSNK